jgi:hypothetical protein
VEVPGQLVGHTRPGQGGGVQGRARLALRWRSSSVNEILEDSYSIVIYYRTNLCQCLPTYELN